MGHIRLGTLPRTRTWRTVFDALEQPSLDAAVVASAIATVTGERLDSLKGDPALTYCFWTLARIVTAARQPDFAGTLTALGVRTDGVKDGVSFVNQVARTVEKGLRDRSDPTVFARIAELSLRDVLSSTVAGRSQSLFGSSLEDVRSACRDISTTVEFGRVARDFFAHYMSRTVAYLTDKELSKHVGPNRQLASPAQALQFQEGLHQYCQESARIVQEYAGGWLSKNNWEQQKEVSESSVSGFAAYALEKLVMELGRRGG